jgi:hypothetical protein
MPTVLEPAGLASFNPAILGDPFNDKAWNEELPYRDELLALGQTSLSRRHVLEAYRVSAKKGVVWTIVWGYPRGKISQYDGQGDDAQRAIDNADGYAEVITDVIGGPPPTAQVMLRKLNKVSKGARTSTTSKIAYFSGCYCREGRCLIFDKQVIKAIFTFADPAILPLRNAITPSGMSPSDPADDLIAEATKGGNQEKLYGRYLTEMNALSFRLGRRYPAERIEQFLFAKGRGDI